MLNIQQQIINYNKSSRSSKPIYIVIHDTGDAGATAQNEHDYFSGGDRQASADFFVDDNNIIQIIDTDNCYSWHCGDGYGAYGISNSNSLGIEMCLQSNGQPSQSTINNTLDLVRYLMNKYGIGIDNVVRHYDASRKSCPNSFSPNNWEQWYDFKKQIQNGSTKQGWNKNSTGWWYCTNVDMGYYYKDTWKQIGQDWFYFNTNGYAIQNNWLQWKEKWYYFNDDCKMCTRQWVKWKDKQYFVGDDGTMLINCFTYDNYWVDENGVWNGKGKGQK
jgi:glucan-binding YG repeat protein